MSPKSRSSGVNKSIIQTRSMAQTQPNTINLDDAIAYLETLPDKQQKRFDDHLMQIIALKQRFPDSRAIDTVMQHHINKGSRGKTKRKKRKHKRTKRKGKK